MQDPDRRQLMKAAAVLAAAAPAAAAAQAPAQAPPPSGPMTFAPKPLPFDPKTITGLSEKLLVSHHDNNYVGAVTRVGAITKQLAALDPATAPGFQLNGLKREELLAWNSMVLHEVYFNSIGAPNRPGAALAQAIERDFGSDARWRAEFSGYGKALGGGSGWVVLVYSHHEHRLMHHWASDHTQNLAWSSPLLALDMYEHAYAMDYGARAAGYVDAFMATINWKFADGLYARASA
jgi:Fe-Mn family superoxide dismutase